MKHPKLIHKIYLAGPLENVNVKTSMKWREKTEKELRRKGGILSYIPGYDTTLSDPFTITKLDFMMIDNSEAVLANLTFLGEEVTATGTLVELGYAKAKDKLIIVYSDKPWLKENRFLNGIVGQFFRSRKQAVDYIIGFNKRRKTFNE